MQMQAFIREATRADEDMGVLNTVSASVSSVVDLIRSIAEEANQTATATMDAMDRVAQSIVAIKSNVDSFFETFAA